MASVWVEGLALRFEHGLGLLRSAIRECPDDAWQAAMWKVADDALLQREGMPWGVAWHALERLDFLLTGGFVPWQVWPPLAARFAEGSAAPLAPAAGVRGHTGLDLTTMAEPWAQSDLLDYLAYCRGRVTDTLEELTDEKAATLVGRRTYAARLLQAHDHVVEHAAQIRQFVTQRAEAGR